MPQSSQSVWDDLDAQLAPASALASVWKDLDSQLGAPPTTRRASVSMEPVLVGTPPESSWSGRATDIGISAAKGAIAVPETAVGLLDIPTRGRVGKALESVGFRPAEAMAELDRFYSPAQQEALAAFQRAPGVLAKAKAALSHPSVIVQSVIESAPLMLLGAGLGRGLMAVAPRLSPILAAAAGEGAVSAGNTAEQVRQETGTLTPRQSTIAALSGALTGGLAAVGGRIAQRLGIADVDTLLVAGAQSATARRGLVKSVIYGAVTEGGFEELPQSVQEQVAQNAATGKPLSSGVAASAVLGSFAGAVMGGLAAGGAGRVGTSTVAPRSTVSDAPIGPSVGAAPDETGVRRPSVPTIGSTDIVTPPPAVDVPSVPEVVAGGSTWNDLDTQLAESQAHTVREVPISKAERETHPYSSTQVNLPPALATQVRDLALTIPDTDLAADGRAGDTPARVPHVTLKYGLETTNVNEVRNVLAHEAPIVATLGTTSIFPNGESENGDIVKVDVDSPDLRRLNAKIADALESTDTHATYSPHVTIAYVVPGKGQQYAGNDALKGQTVTFHSVQLSTPNGQVFEIPLTGQPPEVSRATQTWQQQPGDLGEHQGTEGERVQAVPSGGDRPLPRAEAPEGREAARQAIVPEAATPAVPTSGPPLERPRPAARGAVAEGWSTRRPSDATRVNLTTGHAATQTLDTLDTGEAQVRLPDIGVVREIETATPQMEAPFSLSGEADSTVREQVSSLFADRLTGESLVPDVMSTDPEATHQATLNALETAAWERIAKRGTFTGRRLAAGLPIDDLADLALIGAVKIARGAVTFAEWSQAMTAEFGERVTPHLQAVYQQAKIQVETLRPIVQPSGRAIPPPQQIPEARLLTFPSLQKMPAPIRQSIADLLATYQGFEAQRRGVQSVARTEALAKDVWLPLDTLRPGTALNAEELKAYQDAIATVLTAQQAELSKIQAGTASDYDKLRFSHLTDVATTLMMSYRGAKAEVGRALGILKTKARILDLQESKFLEAALSLPGFERDVRAVATAVAEAQGDPLKQLQWLKQRATGTWFDYLQAYLYTNMLSGVKSHERNIIGNSFNVFATSITPLGAAPLDLIRSQRTGSPREVFLGEIPQTIIGGWVGLDQGIRNAAFTFRYGFRPSTVEAAAAGQFDTQRVELPGGAWTNAPGRLLEAADEFFRAVARHQELYAGLYTQARQEGLRSRTAIVNRMATLMTATDPATADGAAFATIAAQADRAAARSLFQEDPGPITRWLLKAKAPTSAIPLRLAALFIAPFVKTPSAILRQGAEFSPAGFAMQAARRDGRAGAQAQGRAALGSAALLGFAWLAATGRLTGAAPSDPGDREEFYASGKQANAVKIGPYWVRYTLFQPFSVPMAAVANAYSSFQDSVKDEAAAQEAFVAALAGAGASILDQSFLSGLGTFLDAINDPTRYSGQWLTLMAQEFVPASGLLRNITQATDATVRRPIGIRQGVQAILPGASSSLPPRRTRFGEEVTRPGPWWQRGFVVPEVSREVDEAVTLTLSRLKVQPVAAKPTLTLRGKPVPLTPEQGDLLIEAIGRERKARAEAIIHQSGFMTLPDDAQRQRLRDGLEAAGRRIREQALRALLAKRDLTLQSLVSPSTWQQLDADRATLSSPDARGGESTGTDDAR